MSWLDVAFNLFGLKSDTTPEPILSDDNGRLQVLAKQGDAGGDPWPVDTGLVQGTTPSDTQPVSGEVEIDGDVPVYPAVMGMTVPDMVMVGAVSGELLPAGGSIGARTVVISVPRGEDTGIHINDSSDATTSKFLIEAGGSATVMTNGSITAIRGGSADVRVFLIVQQVFT